MQRIRHTLPRGLPDAPRDTLFSSTVLAPRWCHRVRMPARLRTLGTALTYENTCHQYHIKPSQVARAKAQDDKIAAMEVTMATVVAQLAKEQQTNKEHAAKADKQAVTIKQQDVALQDAVLQLVSFSSVRQPASWLHSPCATWLLESVVA